jgi:hypothetical protein
MPRAPLLIGLLAALACHDPVSTEPVVALGSPLMARSAPQVFNEHFPVSFTLFACTGEQVSVSGEAHSVIKVWVTPEEFRTTSHLNLNIVGVGLSTGLQYRFLETANTDYELTRSTGNVIQQVVSKLKAIAPGSASDWHLTMHGTYVYETGVWRFIPRRWESVCT